MFRYFLGIFGAGIFLFVLNACSHAIFSKKDKIKELSTKAIFLYLQQPEEYLSGMFIGKGKVKLDPLLCQRVGLNKNGKVYFDDPMDSEVLKKPSSQKKYQLEIPDSLKVIFEYTGSDPDFEHDYAIIHQFSQLLTTTEPNIHVMEHYNWTNRCGKGDEADTSCIRILNREYLKFKIEGKKIKLLEGLLLRNQLDFIGLGYFSRKKMEDALPGEKITKFGW